MSADPPPEYQAVANSESPTIPFTQQVGTIMGRPTKSKITKVSKILFNAVVEHVLPLIEDGIILPGDELSRSMQKSAQYVPGASFDWADINDRVAKQLMFDLLSIINPIIASIANLNGYVNSPSEIKDIIKNYSHGLTNTNPGVLGRFLKTKVKEKINGVDPYVASCVARFVRDNGNRNHVLVKHNVEFKNMNTKPNDEDAVSCVKEIINLIYGRTLSMSGISKQHSSIIVQIYTVLIMFEETLNGVVNATNAKIMETEEVECIDKFYSAWTNYCRSAVLILNGTGQGIPYDGSDVLARARAGKKEFRQSAITDGFGGSMR